MKKIARNQQQQQVLAKKTLPNATFIYENISNREHSFVTKVFHTVVMYFNLLLNFKSIWPQNILKFDALGNREKLCY